MKDSVTLSGQRRHWSHFNVQTRCNLLRVFFGVIILKRKYNWITTNQPEQKKKITTSNRRIERGKTRTADGRLVLRGFVGPITNQSNTKFIDSDLFRQSTKKITPLLKHIVIKTRLLRYQDVHNQAYIMVMASNRWLGARLDCLASLLVGAVALAAILVSQDAGKLKILTIVLVFLCKVRIYIVVY